jgi:restriction system protein
MANDAWMIRAGEGGYLIDQFEKGIVTVGWPEAGEISDKTQRDLRLRLGGVYPASKAATNQNAASVLWRFAKVIKVGDTVVTYDPTKREYLIGQITGEYQFQAKRSEHPHVREATWKHRVPRDQLSVPTRNSLGSTLALFAIPAEAINELHFAAKNKKHEVDAGGLETRKDQLLQSNRDAEEQARELIEDKILALDPYGMQELIAAVLRSMGYRTRVSPPGADRGVDVLASPDGLGLQEPRIKVEVKHRPNTAMGSNEVRSFLGSLRSGDRGLYVSTGSFSKEAKYEAERGTIPVTLIDLRELAQLVTDNYENFDTRGRALLPLVRIYRPAE